MSTSAGTDHPFRRVARVVIEFTTPFHVGTGEGGCGADALVVQDANGLPTIPGSSLVGVLRAMFKEWTDDEGRTDRLFGFQKGDQGQGSRLSLSWAAIHGADDQPVEGVRPRACLEGDEVLKQALGLRIRDHVRLTHRGAAEHGGKFDDSPVAAGHRFTFEMELVDQADDTDWNRLLDCLQSRALRLGGKSRRGYGAFEVRRILEHSYNLAAPQEFTAYTQHPAGLSETPPALVEERPASPVDALDTVTITLKLKPRGYWMFGGGEDNPPQKDDPADMAPLREERIAWNGATGSVQRNLLLLPGSAIKGAISHRVAFHCNRLAANPRFADTVAAHCGNDAQGHKDAKEAFGPITGGKNPAVRELFGHVEEREQTNRENQASRGKVLINDLFWPGEEPASQRVPHVSIDRFTGGAADGKLFSERSLWQGDDFPDLTLTILAANQVSATARQALKAALDDLVEGRLALGAGAGRGLGWFEPKPGERQPVDCSAGDEWFKQGPAPATPEAHAAA